MRLFLAAMMSAMLLAPPALAKPPDTWDGLHLVRNTMRATVYLLPDADFRAYSKVMLDPTEVAFRKNWQRGASMGNRLDSNEILRISNEISQKFGQDIAASLASRGYTIVEQPGDDVLRLKPAVMNLSFIVPDQRASTRTYARETGEATLVLEARDSMTNALLGRALDAEIAGDDSIIYMTTNASLRNDFARIFGDWSKRIADGLDQLKANSPIDMNGQASR